jgi:hypothetical protein
MNIKNLIIISLSGLLVLSCTRNQKRIGIEKIVSEWKGKQIIFPDDVSCCIFGKDTTVFLCDDLLQSEYKILLYVDSTGCTSCKLQLLEWKEYINEADSLPAGKPAFLFFFNPKDRTELRFFLRRDDFDYPVFIDESNEIDRLNHFPKELQYQCFLLDRDNRVLALGNPVHNPKIWELYKKIINENRNE